MKRFLLLLVLIAAVVLFWHINSKTLSRSGVFMQALQASLEPISLGGLENKLIKLKELQQDTENLLVKRAAERDAVKSELSQLVRRSDKTPNEIKEELAKEKSELDSQLWFQEIKGTWNKLKVLERDVVVFTRQDERLKMSIVKLEQAIEIRKHDEENRKVYIEGDDPELDKLIAQGDVAAHEAQWDGLSAGEQMEINIEVDKFIDESMDNSVSKIPGLDLESIDELPSLPAIASKVGSSDQTPKILFGRVKNDCNKIVDKVQEEASEYLKEKRPEAACSCWLDAIKQLNEIVNNANSSNKFSSDFFKDYVNALKSCQNKTFRIMSKPYMQTFFQCVGEDLESEDPDWDAISESLEGMLRINPPLIQSEVEAMEEKLEVIRALLGYLIKQNDWDAKVKSKRLETVLDKAGEAVRRSKSEILYNQAKELRTKKQYDKALKKINEVLAMHPTVRKYLEEKQTIEQEKAEADEAARKSKAEELYKQAKGFRKNKQFDKSLDKIIDALAMYPSESKYLEEKRTIEQEKTEAAEAARKSKADSIYSQAKEFRINKQYAKALSRIEEALTMYPTNSKYLDEKQIIEKLIYPKAGERMVKTVNGVQFAFRWCPAGSFTMGSPEWEEGRNDYSRRERNRGDVSEGRHKVTLSNGYWMMETEVTQRQWKAIMGYNPSSFKGDDLPVERVSWNACQSFCKRCSELGLPVQLPTEAQWEYACRAGTTGAYAGSLSEMGWYRYNTGRYRTHQVGMMNPNAWGLYDMHGNVWEWCSDWYGDYPGGSVTNPTGPLNGYDRVNRGGSFRNSASACRSALRDGNAPQWSSDSMGFRCVKAFETLDVTSSTAK